MKTYKIVLMAVVGTLAIASLPIAGALIMLTPPEHGETATQQAEPTPSPQAEPSPLVEDDVDMDAVLVALMRSEYPLYFSGISDQEIVDLAEAVCLALDSGSTAADLAVAAFNSGVPAEIAGFLMGAAVAAYCPAHEGVLS